MSTQQPFTDRRASAALSSQFRQQILSGRIPAGEILPRVRNLSRERDFEMVGWWTREAYADEYLPLFAKGPVPPAVTWSVATMTETALARVKERRVQPQLPAIQLRVPMQLRCTEKVTVK